MRLSNISIQNYRSITSAKEIPLEDYCIILGKNNEGKTNVLRAINLGMVTLLRGSQGGKVSPRIRIRNFYDFERDYPVSLKNNGKLYPTKLVLQFILTEEERNNFWNRFKIFNNGKLSVEIVYGKDNTYQVYVKEKRGKGAKSYKNKLNDILMFLTENISFQYIPAVRVEDDSLEKLNEIVYEELDKNDYDEEYKKALKIVQDRQEQLMDTINEKVSNIIKVFLPEIKSVKIGLPNEDRRFYRRGIDFFVDDGTITNLSYKGDGIKSIITLALLNSTTNQNGSRIIAIEEPESHLHPDAIHQINSAIEQLSEKCQVIVTTHNGVFVNRNNISSNIIIDKGIGKKADSIDEIRELLGIKLSDNLICAEMIIIVEGVSDERIFKYIFPKVSAKIKAALDGNQLKFTALGGASKISYMCSFYSNNMCKYFVIFDGDNCGARSFEEAKQRGLIKEKNSAILYGNNKETELEDYFCKSIYEDMIFNDYGVSLDCKEFNKSKFKWSDRLKKAFVSQSKSFSEQTEAEIKEKIATIICSKENLTDIFPDYYYDKIQNICKQIEELL